MKKYKCTTMDKLPRLLVAPLGSHGINPTHYAVNNSPKISYSYQNKVFTDQTDKMVVYKNCMSLCGIGKNIYRVIQSLRG